MLNDFYALNGLQKEEGVLRCNITFNIDHEIFKGHFPGNPVVPGVCTMALVKDLLESVLQRTLLLKESKAVKFLGLITPLMKPQLAVSWKEEGGVITATATLKDAETALFKMSGLYEFVAYK